METSTDLNPNGVREIAEALLRLLADVFTLHVKTKNFHWHMSGRHFRDYHLLLDEQADQVFTMIDEIAERARKIGARTIRSVGDISLHRRLKDNDDEQVSPDNMLKELSQDNRQLARFLRATHAACEQNGDIATAGLIEVWVDQTERRYWFLSQTAGSDKYPCARP